MTQGKKLLLGLGLLATLLLGLLTGVPAMGSNGSVPVARAADCDVHSPPPDLDCPVEPTPTPTPLGH